MGNSDTETTMLGEFLKAGVAARKGEAAIAAQNMQEAMGRIDWDRRRPAYAALGWSVYLDDALLLGSFYVDHENCRIITGTDTWDLLSYESQAKYALLNEIKRGASGTKIVPLNEGYMLDALRAKQAGDGAGEVIVIDRLEDMRARAQALVTEAASINDVGVSPVLRSIYGVRFATLMDEWQQTLATVAEISSAIDMAVDALD